MQKLFFALSLILFLGNIAHSQCPEGSLYYFGDDLSNITQFPTDYPNCTRISGNLTIENEYNITFDRTAFNNIEVIEGNFRMNFPEHVPEFTSLDTIYGSVYLKGQVNDLSGINHTAITNLSGLENIKYIGGDLVIRECPHLDDCSALCNILANDIVQGDITLYDNKDMCNEVEFVKGSCGIINCPSGDLTFHKQSVIDVFKQAFPNCTTIPGHLSVLVSSEDSPFNLDSLNNITTITGDLRLMVGQSYWNGDGSGLSNVTSIGGNILIKNIDWLPLLTEIQGNLAFYEGTFIFDSFIGGLSIGSSNAHLPNLQYLRGQLTCDQSMTLPVLSTIDGKLNSSANTSFPSLTTITGELNCAENVSAPLLTTIGENLKINENVDYIHFPNLNFIGGSIINAHQLSSWSGLSNLREIGGDMTEILTTFSGLGNLEIIGGNFNISETALTNLNGLQGLTTVGGTMTISNNSELTNVDSLINLEAVGGNFIISTNFNLVDCSGICNLFENDGITGNLILNANPMPCNSQVEITATCESENFIVSDQDEADDFLSTNPGNVLDGNLIIGSEESFVSGITNLNGLHHITSVTGNIIIGYNVNLTNLSGLNNLTSIGKNLVVISNLELLDLSDLSGLTYVGGSVQIENNTKLLNVNGLEGLTEIGNFTDGNDDKGITGPSDNLIIKGNIAMTNLDGLSNTTALGGNLEMTGNLQLTDCDGLCGLFSAHGIGGTIDIANNPSPCSSEANLNNLCVVDIDDLRAADMISVYPNPVHESFTLSGNGDITKITIYDNLGKVVYIEKMPKEAISVVDLPKGLSLLEVVMEGKRYYRKMVIW